MAGKVDLGVRTRIIRIGAGRRGWRDKIDYAVFLFKALLTALCDKPDVIIGYNALGVMPAFFASKMCPGTRLVYHNFDFNCFKAESNGILQRILRFFEFYAARQCALIVFPHPERGKVFKKRARLKTNPITMMNCYPLSTVKQKSGELQALLVEKGMAFQRLVVRLGMIGPYHGIEATIRSVPEWRGDWGLVIAGFPDENSNYVNAMKKLIMELGLGKKVMILTAVPYSLWYDCLYCAHLGISLYEPFNLSHEYMSGTSQKFNNYLVAGIPSVVSDSPDFVSFMDLFGIGKVADPKDPASIAKAVNAILADPKVYDDYCGNVRKIFESEFNFEKQFEPFSDWLAASNNESKR